MTLIENINTRYDWRLKAGMEDEFFQIANRQADLKKKRIRQKRAQRTLKRQIDSMNFWIRIAIAIALAEAGMLTILVL